jgi:hypothetical protein
MILVRQVEAWGCRRCTDSDEPSCCGRLARKLMALRAGPSAPLSPNRDVRGRDVLLELHYVAKGSPRVTPRGSDEHGRNPSCSSSCSSPQSTVDAAIPNHRFSAQTDVAGPRGQTNIGLKPAARQGVRVRFPAPGAVPELRKGSLVGGSWRMAGSTGFRFLRSRMTPRSAVARSSDCLLTASATCWMTRASSRDFSVAMLPATSPPRTTTTTTTSPARVRSANVTYEKSSATP